jgi:hypothetical protein
MLGFRPTKAHLEPRCLLQVAGKRMKGSLHVSTNNISHIFRYLVLAISAIDRTLAAA